MTSDPIFQSSLQDLVKGIRSNKRDPSVYISQQIAQIKNELKSTDISIKSEAVRKLTHLQMIGYNVSWASFGIVEVMSQPRFAYKRVGYLAANQSFNNSTDVILLTTNLFKKEFSMSSNQCQYEVGLAINCLANIATHDLARDCLADLVQLMAHGLPYVRKKAVLGMYKLYERYPQGLRLSFEKLKERLEDGDSAVVSSAVNVICELANKNPKNYLSMAPKFFRLLTTSSNNWMLIKVVKLLGSLLPEEPRLARKLLDPLCAIIQNTGAKSLQYECMSTLITAFQHTRKDDGTDAKGVPIALKLCGEHLRSFVEDSDQNLKYLGLVGLVGLLKSHPRAVVEHRDLVLKCLGDDDATIRTRALELLAGIVSRKSLVDLVTHLLEHVKQSQGTYKEEIVHKILFMCSKEKFALVSDFAWYVSVLSKLASGECGIKHGAEVATQLLEVSIRVDSIRPFAVECMLGLLFNEGLILSQTRSSVSETLGSAAWIIGEYSTVLGNIIRDTYDDDDEKGYWFAGPQGDELRSDWRGEADLHTTVMDALLHPRVTLLSCKIQTLYLQAALKVFVRSTSDCDEGVLTSLVSVLRNRLGIFLQSQDVEVQERSNFLRSLLANFDVIPLDWKLTVEESRKCKSATQDDKSNSKSSGNASLIDNKLAEDPNITPESILDQKGSRAAKKHSKTLLALVNEPFYPVHSKAQKRVALPEGLDLNLAIDSAALQRLLSVNLPDQTPEVTFVSPYAHGNAAPTNVSGGAMFGSSNSSAWSDGKSASFGSTSALTAVGPSSGLLATITPSSLQSHNPSIHSGGAENLYYLQASSNSSNQGQSGSIHSSGVSQAKTISSNPLSQLLAEAFEDKKGKKGGKITRRQQVNCKELIPASGVDDDDDDDEQPSKSSQNKAKHSTSRQPRGLEDVDLTTPLREDETYAVLAHRVVQSLPTQQQVPLVVIDTGLKSKKSKKHSKDNAMGEDDLEKKGRQKSHREKKESVKDLDKTTIRGTKTNTATEDLLSMDWSASTTSIPAHHAAHSTYSVSPTTTNQTSQHDIKSANILGLYSVPPPKSPSTTVATQKTTGQSSNNLTSQATNADRLSLSFGHLAVSPEKNLGRNLNRDQNKKLVSVPTISNSTSALGLSPHVLDPSGFTSILSQQGAWASTSMKLSCNSSKAKYVFRALCEHLQAHQVETESSKAAAFCSISNRVILCCLAKFKKEDRVVNVDLKCISVASSSVDEAKATINTIANSLKEIIL